MDGIKIHMLNILKSSALYQDYKKEPFELLSLEEYVDIVVRQLEVLPPEMVIERVTGDGMEELTKYFLDAVDAFKRKA